MKVAIIGASGKLGKYMIQHCLDKGYMVTGVCRPQSVKKLDEFKNQIKIIPGKTNEREVIQAAVKGRDAVLTVLVPWGSKITHQAQLKQCWISQRRMLDLSSPAVGILVKTAKIAIVGK
ncbi:MAG: NmrA family NAD(P)-binding protein [Bdellovibrionales bacterium]